MLHAGDCLAALAKLPDDSVDSVVTDPPYHLTSGKTGSKGFMGKAWDGGDIAFRPDVWREALRVLKPGGHLLAFSGSRTYHRMAVAIEDAGFEIRDQIAWVYGSGFPKSLDVSKAIDEGAGRVPVPTGQFKRASIQRLNDLRGAFASHPEETKRVAVTKAACAAAREWQGWGTALKPALEPICVARKPLSERTVAANVLKWGTGALNIDAGRINYSGTKDAAAAAAEHRSRQATDADFLSTKKPMNFQPGEWLAGSAGLGRWPANFAHDGSDEVLAEFPATASGSIAAHHVRTTSKTAGVYGERAAPSETTTGDSGSAARFFYCAKASRAERRGSKHPTVKPLALMRWLVRLVTPPGGLVLDPFAGTGATAEAALAEGFRARLIEREAEYRLDIARRLTTTPKRRNAETPKRRNAETPRLRPVQIGRTIGPVGLRR